MMTLRVAISHAVNAIHKLTGVCASEQETERLRTVRNDYFVLWQRVILTELDPEQADFAVAVEAMQRVQKLADEALEGKQSASAALSEAEAAAAIIGRVL